ncbi:MAG: hypothetical protein Kow0010_13540 [Dehalococcoidia bacterium]
MAKDTWPSVYARTGDRMDIALMPQPGTSPAFLVATPASAPGRVTSGLIAGIADFCSQFVRDQACYEFEWRGIGLSSRPATPITVDDLVQDLAAVAEAIGEPFHLVAFGSAYVPAVAFAATREAPVLSLLIEDPRVPDSPWWRPDLPRKAYDDFLATMLRTAYDFPPHVVAPELVALLRHDVPQAVLDQWYAAIASFDLDSALRQLAMPVLIHARAERAAEAAAIAGRLARSRTVIGRGHPYNGRRGAALRSAFDGFWNEVSSDAPAAQPVHDQREPLTTREAEVLRLVAAGMTNRAIANELHLSVPTVATHLRHILEKTGAANRAEAATVAVRQGLA